VILLLQPERPPAVVECGFRLAELDLEPGDRVQRGGLPAPMSSARVVIEGAYCVIECDLGAVPPVPDLGSVADLVMWTVPSWPGRLR
jgi:hypothetical protein